jgi:5'-deoxynucleotidase YfbR-like HD superfamily hydrolase
MKRNLLNKYLEADSRLKKVIKLSRAVYDEANLPNHNFDTHIAQVLYRALVIANNDNLNFNPSILIAACLLHDIGYSVTLKKEGHEKAGEDISRKILKQAEFSLDEIDKIVKAFIEYLTPGISVESDILFDADILNQIGYASMYPFFVSLYEYKQFPDGSEEKYRLDVFLKSRIEIIEQIGRMGLRTKAGQEISKDGIKERKDFIEKAVQGVKQREDFLVTFQDLVSE